MNAAAAAAGAGAGAATTTASTTAVAAAAAADVGSASAGASTTAEPLSAALWANVFTYLSLFELLSLRHVSRQWRRIVANDAIPLLETLDFSQFWTTIGVMDPAPLASIIGKAPLLRSLSFAYCHHLNDVSLMPLLDMVVSKSALRRLDLMYCYAITDQSVRYIVRSFPNLEQLRIESCFELTDKSIQAIAQYGRSMRRLIISNNENFTNDILIDLSTMVSLQFVDIQKTKIEEKFADEHRESFPNVQVVGPRFVAPVFAGTRPPRQLQNGV